MSEFTKSGEVKHEDLPDLPSSDEDDFDDQEYIPELNEEEAGARSDDAENDDDEDDEEDGTLTQLTIMAQEAHSQNQIEKAEKLFRAVLAGRTASSGSDHPKTLFAQNNLALFLQQSGKDLNEAQALLESALTGYEKARGPNHSETLCCCNNLGMLLYVQEKDLNIVESLFRRSLVGNEEQLGPKHPSTLAAVSNLARVLDDLEQLEEAGTLYERSLASKQKKSKSIEVLEETNDLAKFFRRQQKWDKALALCQTACDGRGTVLGENHSETLASYYGLAAIYIGMEQWVEAETAAKKCLMGYATLKMTEDLNDAFDLLIQVLENQGKVKEIVAMKQWKREFA